jgi:hypothetical protein
MATSPTIERPGVQVIQQFRTASPTILIPTLPACIVGPCNQIIEAVQDDGSLNPAARIALPARFAFAYVSSPFEYTSVGTNTLELSVNNAAAEQVVFGTGPNLTVDQVVDAILTAEIPGLTAVVEESGTQKRVVVYTTSSGENASLEVGTGTSSPCLTAFGITKGLRSTGSSGYMNFIDLKMGIGDYPDPRSNIDLVVVDYDTVRAFMNDGSGKIREVLRTESFLEGATSAVTVQDDGDGDNLSPYLNFSGGVFHTKPATLLGSVDWSGLSYPAAFGTSTLELIVNGVTVVVTFANPGNATAAALAVNTALGVNGTCVISGGFPLLTSALSGVSSSIEIGAAGTINEATIGLVVGRYAAGKPARARAQGNADLTAITYATSVQGRVLRMSVGGGEYQQLVFGTGVASAANVITAINELWGSVSSLNGANNLVLRAADNFGGAESEIRIDKNASDSTLLTALGLIGAGAPFNSTSVVFGGAFAPRVGDEVWANGVRLGQITEVPATPDNRLRISVEQLLSYSASSWTIIAKGLDNQAATLSRPSSDLIVDTTSGSVRIKHGIFRETGGTPTAAGPLGTYLAYNGLRQDVSPANESFNLLSYGTTTDLEADLSPIDPQNPLGFGIYFALLNAPGVEVSGAGVGEATTGEPEGSLDAYIQAFEFLESKNVYAIAPMTHADAVGQALQVHVNELSKPENGLERIAVLNPKRPTRKSDTLVASVSTANVAGAPTDVIGSGLADLQAKLAALGKAGPTYTITDGVFVVFEDDQNRYLVESISGPSITINNGPLTQTDAFFLDGGGSAVFADAIVDRPMTVFIRGGSLGNRTDEAAAYADLARSYADRRVIVTAPDAARASVDGLETGIEGYYLSAALAGVFSSVGPSKPLTEESLAGFKGVTGSSDRYSELQLRMMSGGGLWVFYAESDQSVVRTRHQLTSDVSTIEKRESSITRAVDFSAIFLRTGLKNFIGRFNITTTVQDAVSLVLDGLSTFLIKNGVLKSFAVNAVRQSASAPDTLEIDVTLEVLYPLNYIKITLVI